MNDLEFANPWEEHKYHIGQIVNNASIGSWYWLKQRIRNGNTEGDDLIVAIKSKLEEQMEQNEQINALNTELAKRNSGVWINGLPPTYSDDWNDYQKYYYDEEDACDES